MNNHNNYLNINIQSLFIPLVRLSMECLLALQPTSQQLQAVNKPQKHF